MFSEHYVLSPIPLPFTFTVVSNIVNAFSVIER